MYFIFFFKATATTEIYTLSLHDALPILHVEPHGVHVTRTARRQSCVALEQGVRPRRAGGTWDPADRPHLRRAGRSEEHTSELQSQSNLVCRLLLEKKKTQSTPDWYARRG